MPWHLWRPQQPTRTSTSAHMTDLHKGVASIQVAQPLSKPIKESCRCALAGSAAQQLQGAEAGEDSGELVPSKSSH